MPWRESPGSDYPEWFAKEPPMRLLPPPSPVSIDEGVPAVT